MPGWNAFWNLRPLNNKKIFRHPEVGEDSENEFSFSKEKMKSSGLEREDVISSGFLPPENNLK